MTKLRINHPTCHTVSLTLMAKTVAFIDMVFGLFGLVWFVVMLSKYNMISLDPFDYIGIVENSQTVKTHQAVATTTTATPLGIMMEPVDDLTENRTILFTPDLEAHTKIISLSLAGFYTAVNLIVFVLLLVGIYKRSPGICLEWFHVRCAIFFFKLIILIMYLIGGRPITQLYHHIPFILSMIVHLYGLWVVKSFVNELKETRLQDQIEECRAQQERALENPDLPNGIEHVLQKRRLDEQIKRNIFNF